VSWYGTSCVIVTSGSAVPCQVVSLERLLRISTGGRARSAAEEVDESGPVSNGPSDLRLLGVFDPAAGPEAIWRAARAAFVSEVGPVVSIRPGHLEADLSGDPWVWLGVVPGPTPPASHP
jgi:hypothetical protein